MSVGPPGVKPTINRTGRAGQLCARAIGDAGTTATVMPAMEKRIRRRAITTELPILMR